MSPLYHSGQSSPLPTSGGVYRITCTPTGKFYIGSTSNLHRRALRHFNELRNKAHCNQKLQHAWGKYGPDAFIFEIIELVSPPLLLEREQYWIDNLQPFFNLAPVAGSLLGMKRTPEHSEKIRLSLLGKPSPMRGIPRTPETIEKVKATKRAKATPHMPWERPCKNCGQSFFNRNHPHQKFCSRECGIASKKRDIAPKNRQVQRTCVICGKGFQRQPSKISNYCSAECSYQAMRKNTSEAFWSKVEKTPNCWLWTGAKGRMGYGLFTMGKKGRTLGAHRFAYEQTYGVIPDGLDVSHHCDTPSCVRPDHLFTRTRADVLKGHQAKGEQVGNAKLTEDDIRAIRATPSTRGKNKDLATCYGVDTRTIWAIRAKKTWKHVP